MSTNYSNHQRTHEEIIHIDDSDSDITSVFFSNGPKNSGSDCGSDIEVIENIERYTYEQKVKAKKKEILNKTKNNFSKESGVYFEHYLGCIETDAIILSSELKKVNSDKDAIFCCEISPKSTKRSYAAMYTLVLNEHYVASNDYVRVRSKNVGIREPPQKKAKKGTAKRKGSGGNLGNNASSSDSVHSYIFEKYISADKKYEESYKHKNDILKDIYNGGTACIRLKHNMTEICKFRNDLSRTISVLLILNAIRIEIEFDKIEAEDFRMAGNLKTYVHVILYPDAFNIDLHKFQEGSHALIKNSVIKLFDELHMSPIREAKMDHSKALTTGGHRYNKMEITTRSGTPIKTVSVKPATFKKYGTFTVSLSPSSASSSSFVSPMSSFCGLQTPHHALDCEGSPRTSDCAVINIENDNDVTEVTSDSENVETKAEAEVITNSVFSEEKYRGGLLVEDFKEIHPNPNYFLPKLKSYQAEGVWWMYLKENPPEYALQKPNTAPSSVKLENENKNKNVSHVRVKSEIVENGTSDTAIKTERTISPLEKKKSRNEIRNKPLNPVWAEYIFEPGLHIFESNQLKCVLKYFYVNKSNGVMSLCFPEYTPPFRGGILSDEMGLGKTIQSIGLIVHDIVDNNLHFKNDKEDCKADDAYLIESTIQRCDFKKGGTLVVAPLSLLFQWKEEIERHTTKGFISAYLYYAEDKSISSEELARYSVVLTTYSTLAIEYTNHLAQEKQKPSRGGNKKKSNKESDNDNNASEYSGQMKLNNFFMKTKLANFSSVGGNSALGTSPIVKRDRYEAGKQKGDNTMDGGGGTSRNKSNAARGGGGSSSMSSKQSETKEAPLFKIIWRRVLIDEAHVIKNKNTTQSLAAWKLRGERKWCITGTPIQNTMEDVFPLLRFIGVKPYGNYEWWNKEVGEYLKTKERFPQAINIVREITSPLLLRRTKASKGRDGNRIVTLPPKNIHIEKLQFTEEEKDFYQAVYYRSKTKFDTYVNEGNIMSHYTHVLQLLLRLRQCCSHPLLLFSKPFFEEWNQEEDTLIAEQECYGGEVKILERFEGVVKKENSPLNTVVPKGGFPCPIVKQEKDELNYNTNKSRNRILFRFLESSTASHKVDDSCLEEIENLKKKPSTVECIICTEDAVVPLITKCMHIMCTKCAHNYFHLTRIAEKPCPLCGHYINLKSLKALEKNVSPIDDLLKKMTKDNFVYSTKLKRLFEYVQKDMKHERHVVVFSQWIGYLKIISKLFTLHDIPNRTYDGSLTFNDRKDVLTWFNIQRGKIYQPGVGFVETKEKITIENFGGKVLLCSLKAGGVGLNLTVASKLYLMDMWWNPAIEDQAYQRVHRIGQLKEVDIYKFVIEKTVEKRILELHETKNTTANEIMTQQGNVVESVEHAMPQKLSVQNLIDMFKDYSGEGSF